MQNLLQHNAVTPDAEIIAKILAGEPALYEVLIRRYNPVIYKIARGYGFNHQDAEDLMQETLVAAYNSLHQFSFRASFKTWLSKIMIHKCLYKLNHGAGHKETTPGETVLYENKSAEHASAASPEQLTMNKEFAAILDKALQNIPVNYREVFLLREVEGFSVAETADLLQISAVNVKVRLNRAKAILQKQLEQFYPVSALYDFHAVYCDAMVRRVFNRIFES